MKFLKLTIVLVAVLALTVPAWSGNIPEFDAVGDDSGNIFALYNKIQYGQVVRKNRDGDGNRINEDSDFKNKDLGEFNLAEKFITRFGAGKQTWPDPCFDRFLSGPPRPPGEYRTSLTPTFTAGQYEWLIVLQMQPESDINLNIYDCVLKHNQTNVWEYAEQTGRYRAFWGELFFVNAQNPTVTVQAWPGEQASPGFEEPFFMDTRTMPGLAFLSLNQQLYTSKALWHENIVIALPDTGDDTGDGQTGFALNAGDIIQVVVDVPPNANDMYYGEDNATLKYIGVIGTWYLASDAPDPVEPPCCIE